MMVAATASTLFIPSASALAGWDAGRIIDDGVFTNKFTMSVDQIQAFLNSKVPECDSDGSEPSEYGGGTRAQWASAKYGQTTFTCLKDYHEHGNSAAQMIYNVAQEFSLNPQVLIVLLQKEQGLVTDEWPLNIQYRSATGYGCPDTAPCDSQYYGLANQLTWSGRMFRAILNNSPSWYTPYVLGNNFIRYSPDASCGGSNVNIQNRSTQALYNYTPYQPNQGALDSGWGTAHCGAYGNRNFYLYFTSWFGSTHGGPAFVYMSDPRWMQLSEDARKVDPLTGQQIDNTLPAGTKIKFSSKPAGIRVNGEECLRTKNDTIYDERKCIPVSSLEELELVLEPIPETLLRTTTRAHKYDIRRDTKINAIPETLHTQQITFNAQVTLGPNTYYVTKHDSDADLEYGMLSTQLVNTTAYQTVTPTLMEWKESAKKVIPASNAQIGDSISPSTRRYFNARVQQNGQWYYRTETDTELKVDLSIPESSLQIVQYKNFQTPRWMQLNRNTNKVSALAKERSTYESLTKGQQVKLVSKVEVEGKWYYRTEADTSQQLDKAIPAEYVEDIPYQAFSSPRDLKLVRDAKKHVPATGSSTGDTLPSGMTRRFISKIEINGVWYYRTEVDTNLDLNTAIKAADLVNA